MLATALVVHGVELVAGARALHAEVVRNTTTVEVPGLVLVLGVVVVCALLMRPPLRGAR